MHKPLAVAALFLASVAATIACLIGGPAAVDAAEALDPATEPIHVELRADPSLAASATIPVAGGTLTATGADGTRYTLEVPADALLEETTITMTPLASMEGLPFGEGQPMAVLLEPSGLALFEFATLSIEAGSDVPIDQQIPIGTSGAAGDLEMPFAEIVGGGLKLRLLHFSSAGATKGLLADMEPWRQRLGGDVEARLQSITAYQMLYYQQVGQAVPETFWQWLRQTWWESVMKPRLDAAGENCAAGRLAIDTALSFERQAQLLGFADDAHNLIRQVSDLLPTVARTCLQEEYELCRDEHIVHRMIPAVQALARQSQLLGLAGSEVEQVKAEGEDLARRCLHFEVEFTSATNLQQSSIEASSTMEGTTPVDLRGSLDAANLHLSGDGDLTNSDFAFETPATPGCSVQAVPGGSTLTVVSLAFVTAAPDEAHPYGSVKDIEMTYSGGFSAESLVIQCSGITLQPNLPIWTVAHQVLHQSEMIFGSAPGPGLPDFGSLFSSGGGPGAFPPGGGAGAGQPPAPNGPTFLTTAWTVPGGELFAEKDLDGSTTTMGTTVTESGSIRIFHRPQ